MQTLNALLVGGVAWYFAHHQKRIAQAKLRLDLFDKRFVVFDAARTFIGRALMVVGIAEIEHRERLPDRHISAHRSCSNHGSAAYLDEILRRAIDLPFLQAELANAPEEKRKEMQTRFVAERKWMRDQIKVLETKFKPFLQLAG